MGIEVGLESRNGVLILEETLKIYVTAKVIAKSLVLVSAESMQAPDTHLATSVPQTRRRFGYGSGLY